MSLIKCGGCGTEVSDKALKCPKCNLDIEKYNMKLETKKSEEEQAKKERERVEEEKRQEELKTQEKCPECDELVNKAVELCPNCGFPIQEEKEKHQNNLRRVKSRNKKRFIIILAVIILIVTIIFTGYMGNKRRQYAEATKLFDQGDYKEAEELFYDLNGYKSSDKKLQIIEIGYEMQAYISVKKDFIHSTLFDHYEVNIILNESMKYEELDKTRKVLIEHLYNIANDYIVGDYGKDYDYAQYLINSISNYIDTEGLQLSKQNAQTYDIVNQKLMDKEYTEINTYLDEVENKNEKLQKLSDTYKCLYEKYGNFLGEWGTSPGKVGFEFSIQSVETNQEECYFKIRYHGVVLGDADINGAGAYCYSNLKVDGDIMSFTLSEGGLLNPQFREVVCKSQDGDVNVTVDGKELYTGKGVTSENKIAPKIGDSAADVYRSSWGKPNKINKTTTKNGVDEQWVYSSDKYIYFENDIVTAIQE